MVCSYAVAGSGWSCTRTLSIAPRRGSWWSAATVIAAASTSKKWRSAARVAAAEAVGAERVQAGGTTRATWSATAFM